MTDRHRGGGSRGFDRDRRPNYEGGRSDGGDRSGFRGGGGGFGFVHAGGADLGKPRASIPASWRRVPNARSPIADKVYEHHQDSSAHHRAINS